MSKIVGQICTSKDCEKKGEKQPFENFYKNTGFKSNYQSACKECCKKRIAKHTKNKALELDNFFKMIF